MSLGFLQRSYRCQQLYACFSHASRFPVVFLTRLPSSFDTDPASLTDYPAFDGFCRSAVLSGNAARSVTSSCDGNRLRCTNSLCRRILFKAVSLKAGFLEPWTSAKPCKGTPNAEGSLGTFYVYIIMLSNRLL